MSAWKKLGLGVVAWLASGLVIYFLPEQALPDGWHRELVGFLLFPLVLLGALLFSGLVQLSFYGLTHGLVRLVSCGAVRVEGPNEFVRTTWGVGRDSEGKLVLDEDLAGFSVVVAIGGAIACAVYFF